MPAPENALCGGCSLCSACSCSAGADLISPSVKRNAQRLFRISPLFPRESQWAPRRCTARALVAPREGSRAPLCSGPRSLWAVPPYWVLRDWLAPVSNRLRLRLSAALSPSGSEGLGLTWEAEAALLRARLLGVPLCASFASPYPLLLPRSLRWGGSVLLVSQLCRIYRYP